jgi:hypothetical protein
MSLARAVYQSLTNHSFIHRFQADPQKTLKDSGIELDPQEVTALAAILCDAQHLNAWCSLATWTSQAGPWWVSPAQTTTLASQPS